MEADDIEADNMEKAIENVNAEGRPFTLTIRGPYDY